MAFVLESGDCFSGVVEEIDVPDVGVDGGVFDGINELDLPFHSGCWLPDGGGTGAGGVALGHLLVASSSELSSDVHPDGKEEEAQNAGYYELSLGG